MFQRRHYEALARMVRESQLPEGMERDALAHVLCRFLAYENDNFQPSRFMKACGV